MESTDTTSVWDEGVSLEIQDAAAKGVEAARREDLRTAYGYFLRAKKAAGRQKFDDLTFLLHIAGLGSGEIAKWNDRLRASKEAARVAGRRIEWLIMLFEVVYADSTGIDLALREAKDQLYEKTSPAMVGEQWSGISWLAGQFMLRQQVNIQKKFEAVANQVLWQILQHLRALRAGQTTDDVLPDALLEVERLADALAGEPAGKRDAALLYTDLLALPEEVWVSRDEAAEGEPVDVEELRDRIAVRLELAQAATRGAGCFGSVVSGMAAMVVALAAATYVTLTTIGFVK